MNDYFVFDYDILGGELIVKIICRIEESEHFKDKFSNSFGCLGNERDE